MSNYQIRYFIAQGKSADDIANKGLEKVKQQKALRKEFLSEFGAIGFYETVNFAPNAIIFETDENRPGFIKTATDSSTGETLYAYRPDQRTKIGKAVTARLKELAQFNFSDYAVRACNVNQNTLVPSGRGMSMAISVAGYCQGHMVFKIPFGGYQGERGVVDVEIPSYFREISESQFIAFVREGKPLDQLAA